jgi:[ribulose-bisphosphate carboxylase]/[fructose-bisphosphate aldolase]-lysine N-methyltransferase
VLDYGAYDAVAPRTGYLLTLSLPNEDEDKCYFDKMDILESQSLSTSASFTLAPNAAPSEDLLAFLRLMNVQGVRGQASRATMLHDMALGILTHGKD